VKYYYISYGGIILEGIRYLCSLSLSIYTLAIKKGEITLNNVLEDNYREGFGYR